MMGVLCSLARGGPRGDRAKSIAVAIAAGMNTARVHRHRLREKDKEAPARVTAFVNMAPKVKVLTHTAQYAVNSTTIQSSPPPPSAVRERQELVARLCGLAPKRVFKMPQPAPLAPKSSKRAPRRSERAPRRSALPEV